MKLHELVKEEKEVYFVMDISHEQGNEIWAHVQHTGKPDSYHISVKVDEATWEVKSISGWSREAEQDVEKDKDEIVAAVNTQFKKHKDLKPVKLTSETKFNTAIKK